MTEEFDNELDNNVDENVVEDSIIETPVVPIESAPEGSLAAIANAIPAAGGPILVDPYAVLAASGAPAVTGATQTYTAPTATTYHGAIHHHAAHYASPTAHYPNPAHPNPAAAQFSPVSSPHSGMYGYGQGYGAPQPYAAPQPYGSQVAPLDGFAIAALVCGVAGLMFFAPVIGSILGIVFGIIALNRTRQSGHRGHGLAVAGIVTGALGLLIGLTALFGLLGLAASTWWYGM